MHVDFDPLQVQWSVLAEQSEPIIQYGGYYNVFRGVPFQRGSGLGSVFRSMWRYLLPIGKEIGAAIGRQGLETGNRVLSNVLEGQDLKQSLANEGKAGLKNLLEKAANKLDAQKGKGFDFKRYKNVDDTQGMGVFRRRRRPPKKSIHKLVSNIGPPNFLPSNTRAKKHKKRLRTDTLGTY